MYTVNEVSKITGVSVRTLHYYDEIDLLKPASLSNAGYRLYDDDSLLRLENILMFRELKFPLKEIKSILDSPDFSKKEALDEQIKLLNLQKKHIEKLILFAHELKNKESNKMDFKVFDKSEIKKYESEVKKRWGKTDAYVEYKEKRKNKTDDEFNEISKNLMSVINEIGKLKNLSPDNKNVREKVQKLQEFITDNFYTCTDEIFIGLGKMYVNDERMKNNINKACGDGVAEFVSEAIEYYCPHK